MVHEDMIQQNFERKQLMSSHMDDSGANLQASKWPYEMIAMESTAVFLVACQNDHHLLNNDFPDVVEP